jgi:hypothetical protein
VPVTQKISRSLALAALAVTVPALAATTITGTVTNKTNNKPAAGDTVTVIRLAQGMQEDAHTTTDARGHYTVTVQDDGIHLIRVTHDLANYFEPAPPGTNNVDLTVYNAAAKVPGVSQEADVLRIQTDTSGTGLQVVENIFIKNDSAPPMTQFSRVPFDFWLPEGAVIGGSAALAPGGMPVQAAPVPLAEKNHYTFLFPIRPGETRFQISYHLPYTGKYTFTPHLAHDTGTVAIIIPKALSLTVGANSPYTPVSDDVDAQTYVARSVTPSQPLSFTLSGTGQLPADPNAPNAADNQQSASPPGQPVPETDNTMPGRGLQNPLDPNGNRDPWAKWRYWILGGLAFLLAIAAGLMLRKPAASPQTSAAPPALSTQNHHNFLLQALKEELFALETDRLQNHITEPEYLEQKAAIETVLRRALARKTSVNS